MLFLTGIKRFIRSECKLQQCVIFFVTVLQFAFNKGSALNRHSHSACH